MRSYSALHFPRHIKHIRYTCHHLQVQHPASAAYHTSQHSTQLPPARAVLSAFAPPNRLRSSSPTHRDASHDQKRRFSAAQHRHTKLQAVLGEADDMDAYNFPEARLKKKLDDPSKTPLLLVACGSFSPITFLHLRMFVMAGDYVKHNTQFEVVGGYLSPVSDAYRKQGLAPAEHR
jgi:hypothetical protein